MRTYPGMPHLNGHLLCSVDLETTGSDPLRNEPVQIAIVPLDSEFKPQKDIVPFYTIIKPDRPDLVSNIAMGVHKLKLEELLLHAPDKHRVADMLIEWTDKLGLPENKRIIPLAHNWPFESGFLMAWLGEKLKSRIFHGLPRDGMILALSLNDKALFRGETPPFNGVGLESLAKQFGIPYGALPGEPLLNGKSLQAHDALHDCLVEAEVYKSLLLYDI